MPITNSIEETSAFSQEIAEKVHDGGIICLFGDLGTGKTTLTKGIAKHLGIEEMTVKSPTYTYIRKHESEGRNIYHIDLYRLNQIDELLLQEIEELFENQKNIVIIEWADRMEEYLPKNRINIHLEYVDETRRNIKVV
jgi:tRNA threonylcarbamoyladenosine biosynthesis protein TsaE